MEQLILGLTLEQIGALKAFYENQTGKRAMEIQWIKWAETVELL